MSTDTAAAEARAATQEGADLRTVGTVGLVATILLVVVNAVHPFDGSTELYGDITLFAEKAEGAVWVVDHLVGAAVLLAVPLVAHAWRRTLTDQRARTWGRFAFLVAIVGTVIGALHLGGVDGAALGSFADVLAEPGAGEGVVAAGAALLRVHLATFLTWVLTFWAAAQLLLAVATLLEGRRTWLGIVLAVGGLMAVTSAVVTAVEGQLTTLSEPILFRPSTVTFTLWLLFASLDLRATGASGPSE